MATDAGNRRGGEQLSPTGRDDQRLPADGQLSLAGGPSAVDGEIDAGRLAANSAMTRIVLECVLSILAAVVLDVRRNRSQKSCERGSNSRAPGGRVATDISKYTGLMPSAGLCRVISADP